METPPRGSSSSLHRPGWAPRSGGPLDDEHADPDDLAVPEAERYEPGGLLGRGGWGEVRAAHDRRLDRGVALKTTRHDDADGREDLVREARLTARLDHPNIVRVHDAGLDPEGRPFYTMPVLGGQSLAGALDRRAEERLRLVRHVLDAVHAVAYAHSQGVLHRDLKPDNILVGSFGQTVVSDWGLACTFDEAAETLQPPLGTPGFMSPEAATGGSLDARTDVYGLGAILYSILVGRPPPLAPVPPVRAVAADAPAELAAIADRALKADRGSRYADAEALAADLEAWFAGRRVLAHPYTVAEEVSRRLRLWRVPLLVGSAAVIGLLLAGAFGWWTTARERDRALSAENDAVDARNEAERSLGMALAAHARAAAASGDQPSAEIFAAAALTHGPSPDARGVLARYGGSERVRLRSRFKVPGCIIKSATADQRYVACENSGTFEVHDQGNGGAILDRFVTKDAVFAGRGTELIVATHEGLVSWTPDGGRKFLGKFGADVGLTVEPVTGMVAIASRSTLHWYDPRTARYETHSPCVNRAMPQFGYPSPDGRVLYACSDQTLGYWVPGKTATPFTQVAVDDGVPSAGAIASDLTGRVAVGTTRGVVFVLDGTTGESLHRLATGHHMVDHIALFRDRLAAATTDGGLWVWELATGEVLARLQVPGVDLTWHDGGSVLRTTGGTVSEWHVPEGARPHTLRANGGISAVSLSPTGELLAMSSGDGHILVYQVRDGSLAADIAWQDLVAKDVAFSPDGRQLAMVVVGQDGKRIYDTRTWQPTVLLPGPGGRRLLFQPDGSLLMAEYDQGLVHWRNDGDRWERTVAGEGNVFVEMDDESDGRPALVDRNYQPWYWTDDRGPVPLPGPKRDPVLSIATQGDRLVLAGRFLEIVERDGTTVARWRLPSQVADVGVSPNGQWIAVGHLDGTTTLWDADGGELLARFAGHDAKVASVEFSPDGHWLWTGSWDRTARAWSLDGVTARTETLLADLEAAWGMTLESVLARSAAR